MMSPPEPEGIHQPTITIPSLGAVKGVLDDVHPVAKFLNVPFGVLTERWRPAEKVKPWQGVRDGTKNGYVLANSEILWEFTFYQDYCVLVVFQCSFPRWEMQSQSRKKITTFFFTLTFIDTIRLSRLGICQ